MLWPAFIGSEYRRLRSASRIQDCTADVPCSTWRGASIPIEETGARCWRFISSPVAVFIYIAADGASMSALYYRQSFIPLLLVLQCRTSYLLLLLLRHLLLNSSGNLKRIFFVTLTITMFNLYSYFSIGVLEVWQAVLVFNRIFIDIDNSPPFLSISINHLSISINNLWLSINRRLIIDIKTYAIKC